MNIKFENNSNMIFTGSKEPEGLNGRKGSNMIRLLMCQSVPSHAKPCQVTTQICLICPALIELIGLAGLARHVRQWSSVHVMVMGVMT
jgi:hypothetical protein